MFLLVPAHPGRPGQRAVKRLCVCVCVLCELLCVIFAFIFQFVLPLQSAKFHTEDFKFTFLQFWMQHIEIGNVFVTVINAVSIRFMSRLSLVNYLFDLCFYFVVPCVRLHNKQINK